MNFNRLARKYVDFPIRVTLRSGQSYPVADLDVALLAPNTDPTNATVWTSVPVTNGILSVLLVGPDATAIPGSFPIPATGAELWIRLVNNDEVDPVKVVRINLV